MNLDFLNPYFIGPYGENNDVFEKILVELLRDHIYWRRNIHPEDTPVISTLASQENDYQQVIAKTRSELHKLTAGLKQSVPFFSPRYIGHMCSDLLMPGLIAQIITTLYNPNNVSAESATVTVDLELEVGKQFATMFGFNTNVDQYPCAWGHLTSGGTVANYESLWNFRAAKFYPIALAESVKSLAIELPDCEELGQSVSSASNWSLLNLSIDKVLQLRRKTLEYVNEHYPDKFVDLKLAIEAHRIENLGMVSFYNQHLDGKQPLVLVAASAHYSWEKAMKVMGFGSDQLVKLPITKNMRLDINALDEILNNAQKNKTPILTCIGILGTTEFGTLDPIHEIISLRDQYRKRGLDFYVHVDAAWGGYLSSLFRKEDGGVLTIEQARSEYKYFPSSETYQAIVHVDKVDSITIDPHKLGYLPYGAGGFISRNRDITQLLTQKAPYVFSNEDSQVDQDFNKLGQYILEGSKPGSVAAAAYVSNKVLPLNHQHMGRLIKQTIKTSECFYDAILKLKEKLKNKVNICLPYTPDTNLICLAINPVENHSLVTMNNFSQKIYEHLKISKVRAPKDQQFMGSSTYLLRKNLSKEHAEYLCTMLDIDDDFAKKNQSNAQESDQIFLFRHTIMNPWLLDESNGKNYIDMYCDYLESLIIDGLN